MVGGQIHGLSPRRRPDPDIYVPALIRLVGDAAAIKMNYGFTSEIIAGSMKTQNHVLACLRAGVDVVTIPESLFLQMFRHPLTDAGLAQFAKDWDRIAG